MDFKTLIEDDLNEVFFNQEEFATLLTIEGKESKFKVIFDEKTEVIFDNSSEYGESVANVPSALMKKEDAELIEHHDRLHIEGSVYTLNYKDEEDVNLVRVYLEKRRD